MFHTLFTQKIVESVISFYAPLADGLKSNRIDQLQYIKSRIRDNPSEVEEWFDNEINRIENFKLHNLSNEFKWFNNIIKEFDDKKNTSKLL